MSAKVEGMLSSQGLKVALIAARFNGYVVDSLVAGATDALTRTGARAEDLTVIYVPGAFEIPQALRAAVRSKRYDAVVCLGAVIRGATPHFEHVANAASAGIARIAAETDVAIGFGVLTCDTVEQAIERAGTKAGNKGFDAAMSAIEMAGLLRKLGNA